MLVSTLPFTLPQTTFSKKRGRVIGPNSYFQHITWNGSPSSLSPSPPFTSPPSPPSHQEPTEQPGPAARDDKNVYNLSMSVTPVLFSKNSDPSRPSTASSDRPVNFDRPNFRAQNKLPSSTIRPIQLEHRYTRSAPITLEYDTKSDDDDLPMNACSSFFSSRALSTAPSSTRSNLAPKQLIEAHAVGRKSKSPESMFHGRKPSLPVIDIADTTGAPRGARVDDAERLLKGSSNLGSTLPPVPTSRRGRDSFLSVLDICAENRVVEPGENGEVDSGGEDILLAYQKAFSENSDELFQGNLGEVRPLGPRPRRSSRASSSGSASQCSTTPTSPVVSLDLIRPLPEVPILSPFSPNFGSVISLPLQPSPSDSFRQSRSGSGHSPLVYQSADLQATSLKPLENPHIYFRLYTSSSLDIASSPIATSSQDPRTPPGLGIEQKDDVKNRHGHRESVETEGLSLSGLHRLPAPLAGGIVGDARSAHSSMAFATSDQSPTASTRAPPSGRHRDSLATQVSTFSDLNRLPASLQGSPPEDEETVVQSDGQLMIFVTSEPKPPPLTISPPPRTSSRGAVPHLNVPRRARPFRPLPPIPVQEQLTAELALVPPKPRSAGGKPEIIDPDSVSDSIISPIVFASPSRYGGRDGDSYSQDERESSPFQLITGSKPKLSSDSDSEGHAEGKEGENTPPVFAEDIVWGDVDTVTDVQTVPATRPAPPNYWKRTRELGMNPRMTRSRDRLNLPSLSLPSLGPLRRPRTSSATRNGFQARGPSPPSTAATVGSEQPFAQFLLNYKRESYRAWVGEWNVDIQDAIKQLRVLK
ncbi:hypothetical protein AX15_003324 [Amanita polypyramis BW_CC]|nr:hypothetical protein AX15_003324 [Amanita polypyramis BW_CC]